MLHTTSTAPPAAEHASRCELPPDVLAFILQPLLGDVASLCAAACIARAWRDAVASPLLWTRIGPLPPAAAARLTDARLIQLVGRAQGGLQHLDLSDVSGCCLTNAGLFAALRRESLLSFAANGEPLTGSGIVAALAGGSRGRVRELRVCGVPAIAPAFADGHYLDDHVHWLGCMCTLNALNGLLAPGGVLDASAPCGLTMMCRQRLCARMVASEIPCIQCRAE